LHLLLLYRISIKKPADKSYSLYDNAADGGVKLIIAMKRNDDFYQLSR